MNTNHNVPQNRVASSVPSGREIMSVLNSCTINMSIEQTLQELQLIVERLSFGSESIGTNMSMDDIDLLLAGDISNDMIAFVVWLQKRNIIRLLIGNEGRLLLTYSVRYYRTIRQVRCSTPIQLSDSFRIKLLTQLRILYPEPTRIIFDTVPSLMAGCVIDDGHTRTDMSLKNMTPRYVGQYVATIRSMRNTAS